MRNNTISVQPGINKSPVFSNPSPFTEANSNLERRQTSEPPPVPKMEVIFNDEELVTMLTNLSNSLVDIFSNRTTIVNRRNELGVIYLYNALVRQQQQTNLENDIFNYEAIEAKIPLIVERVNGLIGNDLVSENRVFITRLVFNIVKYGIDM